MAQIDSDVILGRRYRLVRRIAAGGMGSVWEAEDTLLHRRVAVKILSEALSSDERFLERFRREARATAGLSHPNVARVFDYGEDGDRPFIVMELIDGETLADRLARVGRVPWREAVAIVERVAAALQVAHVAGIVHRDVKPGNIMLTRSGDVKVMDFGIAAATWATPLTSTGTAMGTATYISPEQASGGRAGPASDVYSLGVVLYEMLTGGPPFTGDTPVAVTMAHIRDTPPPVEQRSPAVPKHVATVCEQALAKDPKLRPPTATAFGSMLVAPESPTAVLSTQRGTSEIRPGTEGRGTAELPVPVPTVPSPRHRARRNRRRGGLLVAALLALILLGAFLAAALTRGNGKPAATRASGKSAATGRSPTTTTRATVPALLAVPDVQGLTLDAAKAKIQDLGLKVSDVVFAQGPEGAEAGTVFDVTPPVGTQLQLDASITLYVAAPCGQIGNGNGRDKHCGGGGNGGGGDGGD